MLALQFPSPQCIQRQLIYLISIYWHTESVCVAFDILHGKDKSKRIKWTETKRRIEKISLTFRPTFEFAQESKNCRVEFPSKPIAFACREDQLCLRRPSKPIIYFSIWVVSALIRLFDPPSEKVILHPIQYSVKLFDSVWLFFFVCVSTKVKRRNPSLSSSNRLLLVVCAWPCEWVCASTKESIFIHSENDWNDLGKHVAGIEDLAASLHASRSSH